VPVSSSGKIEVVECTELTVQTANTVIQGLRTDNVINGQIFIALSSPISPDNIRAATKC